MKKLLLLLALIEGAFSAGALNDYQNSIVKIFATKQEYDYSEPWKRSSIIRSSATGFIIEGGRILTNAHAVSNEKFIQVRFDNNPEKISVDLEFISDDYDLAVLKFRDDFDRSKLEPLQLGGLPNVQDAVTVYGYPQGGDGLSITKGIISRIQLHKYVYSQQEFSVLQTDAAINPGNSGGPVFKDGLVVGVAFQGQRSADNIGYIIPVHIIKHFLKDISDGEYNGIPSLGLSWSKLESKIHRRMLGMRPEQTGILIKRVLPYSSLSGILQNNDVLLAINGYPIGIDGSIEFRQQERVSYNYVLENTDFGEGLSIKFLRNGQALEKKARLKEPAAEPVIANYSSITPPTYHITSGFIFEKLSINYLNKYTRSFFNRKDAPYQLLSIADNPPADVEEIVFIVSVLPDEANIGYQKIENLRVEKVNGVKVLNFKALVSQLHTEGFIVLEGSEGEVIVIDGAKSKERDPAIMKNYNIPQLSSE
ncbi:MAG: trypsin-like peptidase domain-containing protein [Phaeodactylibacter sp.]|nr:trypsin-like peptidase domain-containing protein [Phaeodactylibacter sp.]